jgi:predicted ATPase
VTVLAGRNSSGKSSLLQSILMVSQTFSNRLADRALLPNGPLVQLGTFQDIFNIFSSSRTLTIGFEFDSFVLIRSIENYKHEFEDENGSHQVVIEPSIEHRFRLVDVVTKFGMSNSGDLQGTSVKPTEIEVENLVFQVSDTEKSIKSSWKLSTRKATPLEISQYEMNFKYLGESEYAIDGQEPTKSEPFISPVLLFHFLPKEYQSSDKIDHYFNVPDVTEDVTAFFASQIRYLGPLRAEPQSLQHFSPSGEMDDIGSKGEYAATVYDAFKDAPLNWHNPNTHQLTTSTLKDTLNTWLHYLKLNVVEVRSETAGQYGVSWWVVPSLGDRDLPLSAMGVGISQVLPILVMGLLAPDGSLLLIEQPELHLHPQVQALLGDFFIALGKSNKQCIIETHSENLVNQLRLRMVEAGGQAKSGCMIYFVEQQGEAGAVFEPIEISPEGNILNWSDGFFDETMYQDDRITAASIKQRMAAKHG